MTLFLAIGLIYALVGLVGWCLVIFDHFDE